MEKIKVEKVRPMRVAYIEHVGPYDRIPWDAHMTRLFGWAKKNRVRPGFRGIGIYLDNPAETPPEQCRSEVAIQIKGDAEGSEGIQVKDLPEMDVAVTKFRGPASTIGEVYRTITQWMEDHGYAWAGPSMEVYGRKPKVVGDEVIISATIQVPVKKK